MGAIEVNQASSVCRRCGTAYSRLKGYFPVSYSGLYKGTGYLPFCRECVDTMFNEYLKECKDSRAAVRQMCRKLNLYWNDDVFDTVNAKTSTRSMMTNYLTAINSNRISGRSYDDTLREEGRLWNFEKGPAQIEEEHNDEAPQEKKEIPKKLVKFWGRGYDYDFYNDLQQKYDEWTADKGKLEQNEVALYKQICLLELTIARDSAAGKPVDKSVDSLTKVLGGLGIKPVQQKDDADSQMENTPFGVWIQRWENQKPIPDVDPALKDSDGIIRYIDIWFRGHLCKMLGIKNAYSKLYEDEIQKLRVERPEYDGEDDEAMFEDVFGGDPP